MTDDALCAYCGHPAVHHAPGRCWTDVPAIPIGWRGCYCPAYVAPAADA